MYRSNIDNGSASFFGSFFLPLQFRPVKLQFRPIRTPLVEPNLLVFGHRMFVRGRFWIEEAL